MDENEEELEVTRLLDIIQKEQQLQAIAEGPDTRDTALDPQLEQHQPETPELHIAEDHQQQGEYPNKKRLNDIDAFPGDFEAVDVVQDGEESASTLPNTAVSALSNLQLQCIPILYNLSTQLLQQLGYGHYQDTLNTVTQPDSDRGHAYLLLLNLFEQTKSLYGEDKFLDSKLLRTDSVLWKSAIQRANLATFVAAVFGSIEVGFYHLNERFLECFIAPDGKFLKSHSILYLDLKTQAYMSAMGQLDKSQDDILDQLFPRILGATTSKTPTEVEFDNKCSRRRQILQDQPNLEELFSRYSWLSFMRDIHDYVTRLNLSVLNPNPAAPYQPSPFRGSGMSEVSTSSTAGAIVENPLHVSSRALEGANTMHKRSRVRRRPGPRSLTTNPGLAMSDAAAAYEAARDPKNNRPGVPSTFTRRPWTKQEEDALLKGLDKVQGPYWAQILELHGPGGSESEVLKDRNQVQLKDKARNLKMFFIKCGLPLPAVFEYVTGDVRSRRLTAQRIKQRQTKLGNSGVSEDLSANANANANANLSGRGGDTAEHAAETTKQHRNTGETPSDDTAAERQENESLEKLIQSVGEYITSSSSPAVQ